MGTDLPTVRLSGHWRGFAVLVLLALSAILLRPVCDALESHPAGSAFGLEQAATGHHEPESTPCCASIEGGSLVASASTPPEGKRSSALALGPALTIRVTIPPTLHADVARPQPPPRGLPYHARTARILV